jgi:hypothetical protein
MQIIVLNDKRHKKSDCSSQIDIAFTESFCSLLISLLHIPFGQEKYAYKKCAEYGKTSKCPSIISSLTEKLRQSGDDDKHDPYRYMQFIFQYIVDDKHNQKPIGDTSEYDQLES